VVHQSRRICVTLSGRPVFSFVSSSNPVSLQVLSIRTTELSKIDVIFGAQGDVGSGIRMLPPGDEEDIVCIAYQIERLKACERLTIVLLRFDPGTVAGRWGTAGGTVPTLGFVVARFEEEPFRWYVEGGVVLPWVELRVEEDFAVGTVPFDSFEESVVRKLALDRLRSSLKKGMLGE
jgi:hypothetical protein